MMYCIYYHEKKIVYTYIVFLILFNLIGLYFIVDLLFYDEIIDYLTTDEIRKTPPHNVFYLLFLSSMSNLLFVFGSLMTRSLPK